jgi:hypothetical protein
MKAANDEGSQGEGKVSDYKGIRPLWRVWLTVACGLVIALSLTLVLFPGIGQLGFNRMILGDWRSPPDFSPDAVRYVTFVYGVLGAVMIGWTVVLLAIIQGPCAAGERWAWRAIVGSTAVWFVIDSIFSWGAGFLVNIALNSAFAAIFAVPLIGSYRDLRPRHS